MSNNEQQTAIVACPRCSYWSEIANREVKCAECSLDETERWRSLCAKLADALAWTADAPDFQENGIARAGWARRCLPALIEWKTTSSPAKESA